MGTLGRSTPKRKKAAARRVAQVKLIHPPAAELAVALKEALERQTATAEILSVIARSPSDTQPVFEAIACSAQKLFGAHYANVTRLVGDELHLAAYAGTSVSGAESLRKLFPAKLKGQGALGKAVLSGSPASITDIETDLAYSAEFREGARQRGYRSLLAVPMLREGVPIGAIAVTRREPGPFTDHQIRLLQTFADQAVIAIENVRLFNETKEALEQQTATAEILKVIASSPTEVQPVFDVIVTRAVHLCGARFGRVYRYDGSTIQMVASHGLSAKGLGQVQRIFPRPAADDTIVGRVILARRPYFMEDIERDQTVPPLSRQMIKALGTRSQVTIPMLRAGEPIGAITIGWEMPAGFDDQQVALLQTFADQAVIAIENVRLFNETKESLERQTATAEILQVIASSPADVQPVFDAIVKNASKLATGSSVNVTRIVGEHLHLAAYTRVSDSADEALRSLYPFRIAAAPGVREAVETRAPSFVADFETDARVTSKSRAVMRARGFRSTLYVPIVREGAVLGMMHVSRAEPGPFPEKWSLWLKTFADQAAIAIENVRLFNETKEALEQQTATAEILKVISGSPTDVKPVFDTILSNGARLCEANFAALYLYDGEMLTVPAHQGALPELAEAFKTLRLAPSKAGAIRLAALEGRIVQVADITKEPGFKPAVLQLQSARTVLGIPLLREKTLVGVLAMWRTEVRPFTDKQIALLKTFADQAVIAIENVRLFNETKESLEQQTATARILGVMSSSPTDVQPVLDAVAESAARLCETDDAIIRRVDPDGLRRVAHFGPLPATPETEVHPVVAGSVGGRAVLERRAIHVADMEEELRHGRYPEARALQVSAGTYRSMLAMPLVREDTAIGVILIRRKEFRPFTDKQIALLKTFADQAVIAIENVRLFNETKEALERQTATAEILKVISGSPTDTRPVLEAIAQSAARLFVPCNVGIGMLENNQIHLRAMAGPRVTQINLEEVAKVYPLPFDPDTVASAKAIVERRVLEFTDMVSQHTSPVTRKLAPIGGFRSAVIVPLIREGEGIGTIAITHPEAGFRLDEKQLALLKTFADQAVIAIENVRLFNETKEALERQTASGEVLRVISRTPADAQPVFDAIAQSALRVFSVSHVGINVVEGGVIKVKATGGSRDPRGEFEIPLDRNSTAGRSVLDRALIKVEDTEAPDVASFTQESGRLVGFRAIATAPMLREGAAVGSVSMMRKEPGPFGDKQLELLQTFADQAVIAIENARLFKELQSRTEALTKSVGQLTALGEVGQAISSTLDLETVLKTIVARAVQLTGLDSGSIYEYDEHAEEYHLRATENLSAEIVERLRRVPIRRNEGPVWQAGLTGQPTQIPEMRDESYQTPRREFLLRAGFRALLVVPLMRENRIVGALSVTRKAPGAFAPEIVELLKTFATQSALAIQNARLFREIAEKGRQLEVASEHKSQFLASMSHELRTPLNALLGFNEMILGDIYGEVPGDMRPPLAQMQSSGKHLLRLINNVLDLAKIEAGRMELALADYSVQDTVEGVRSTLRPLAAEKGLEFLAAVPADIPLAYGDSGRIMQCLMNLVGNSLKFTKAGKVEISVAMSNGRLRYCVADTGIGIPRDKIDSLFTEFRQTDATVASEYGGTGLGLSISKKFVEMHGGRIWVESEPGRGSVFTFEVPLRAREGTAAP